MLKHVRSTRGVVGCTRRKGARTPPKGANGVSASTSENSLCRARSFSNGSSSSQQASPQVKASPSFTFTCSHPAAPLGSMGQNSQKGASRVLALVRELHSRAQASCGSCPFVSLSPPPCSLNQGMPWAPGGLCSPCGECWAEASAAPATQESAEPRVQEKRRHQHQTLLRAAVNNLQAPSTVPSSTRTASHLQLPPGLGTCSLHVTGPSCNSLLTKATSTAYHGLQEAEHPHEELKPPPPCGLALLQNISRRLNSEKLSETPSLEILMPRPSRIPIRRRPAGRSQHLVQLNSCTDDSALKVWKYTASSQLPAQSSLPEFPLDVPELTVTGQREEPLFLCNPPKVLLDEHLPGRADSPQLTYHKILSFCTEA